jgi:hypothetical protein
MRCGVSNWPISAITASSSPGLMWVMMDVDAACSWHSSCAQRGRAQVAADARELALVVAERGLDHEVRTFIVAGAATAAGSGRCRRCRPTSRVRRRRREADRRHGVRRAQHLDARAVERSAVADRERLEREHRRSALGRRVKSGQITPLKMWRRSASSVSGSACTTIGPRAARAQAQHAVGEQADRQHVVEVRMADQDVVDARQLVERQVADAGAGVDEHAVVEQERGGPAAGGDGPGATEDANDHGVARSAAAAPGRAHVDWLAM